MVKSIKANLITYTHRFITLTPILSYIIQPTIPSPVRVHAPIATFLSVEPTLPLPIEDTL